MNYEQLYQHFLSFMHSGTNSIHPHNYQQLNYTFYDFCSCQEQTLMFHYFLEQLFTDFLSRVPIRNISCDKWQRFNCMFTHCFSFKVIRKESYHFWIFYQWSNTYFSRVFIVVCTISTINHFTYSKRRNWNKEFRQFQKLN